MRAVLGWIDERTGISAACASIRDFRLPGRARWSRALPATILFAFCVQALTGFFLWVYYSPSAQTAWESVYYFQQDVAGGWLVRAIHHYGAQVLMALAILYVLQLIFSARYRAPRELVFWVAIGMGLCALASLLTGDLLSWSQNGYWATQVRTGFLKLIPVLGQSLFEVAIGGPGTAFGHLTLTRFFALHVGVFAATFVLLLILHALLAQRADAIEVASSGRTAAYWPNHVLRGAVACVIVMAAVLALASQHGISGPHAGASLGSPADPLELYTGARPEWVLRGVYAFSQLELFAGPRQILAIFIIPGIVFCYFLAMPFIARTGAGHRLNVGVTAILVAAIVGLSSYSYLKDAKDETQQDAIAAEREQADRAKELARGQGIPAAGILTLMHSDPKTQGPKLFKQHCASCHDHLDSGGEGIAAEKPSAPNLYGYPSREWILGLLDAQRIKGPHYFGGTKLAKGEMVEQVKTLWDEAKENNEIPELTANFEKVAAALAAEAGLKSRRDVQSNESVTEKQIAEGRELMAGAVGCTDCHPFRQKAGVPGKPYLTGWGSRDWLIGIINNPADKKFYGKLNDRMPAYSDILTPREVQLLSDWLRGEWYEEE